MPGEMTMDDWMDYRPPMKVTCATCGMSWTTPDEKPHKGGSCLGPKQVTVNGIRYVRDDLAASTGGERDEPRYPGESDEQAAFRAGVDYGERLPEGSLPVEVENDMLFGDGCPPQFTDSGFEFHDGPYWLLPRQVEGDDG